MGLSRKDRPKARLRLENLEDRTTPATLLPGFTEATVTAALTAPTAMELAPNGDVWVLEQAGTVKRFRSGSQTADVVGNIGTLGIDSVGERGLLGIAFDPSFNSNKLVYLYYTKDNGSAASFNRISRFTVNTANAADYSFVDTSGNPAVYDEQILVNLDPLTDATNHNGGAIHFGPDGKLYVAVGDNNTGSNAQSLANRKGKMLRYNPDGSIPADNPTSFAGIAGTTSGANRAIWAVGLRNPFTFAIQPGTGKMFINDVGQNTWEEVNQGGAGRNFGWPTTEGNFNQSTYPNFTRPVYAYNHGSGAFQGYAIAGGAFYNPATSTFPAEYQGDYFFGDVTNSWINVMNADGTNVRTFASATNTGTLDLKVGADGSLYYLTRYGDKRVRKITYTGSLAPAITDQPDNVTVSAGGTAAFTVTASGNAPLSYQWQKLSGSVWNNVANGTGVSGATTATLTLSGVSSAAAGSYRVRVTNNAGSATSSAATLTVTSNQAPTASINITGGLVNGKFNAGQQISFSGTASDPEDGTLAASRYTWKVEYITSIDSGNPQVRPFVPEFGGVTTGVFTPATSTPYLLTDVAFRVTLTVADSGGLTRTVTRDVFPNVSTITVASNVPGLTLTVDGQPYPAPSSVQSVVGLVRPIGAAATQSFGGKTYRFVGWSDNGAATHDISVPAANTTYTATYVEDTGNVAPTNIALSNTSVQRVAGAVVGTLSATDPNPGDTLTFSLVPNASNNWRFEIVGNQLKVVFPPPAGTTTQWVTVRVTDAGGLTFDKAFQITFVAAAPNAAPTDISLSSTSVQRVAGAVVGTLTATDPNAGDTLTFSLVSGASNNWRFVIDGNQLKLSTPPAAGTTTQWVTVRVTDAAGLWYDESFQITFV